MKDNPEKYKAKKQSIARAAGDHNYKNPLYTRMDNGRIVVDHKKTAHMFIKMIEISPIRPLCKRIMRLRLIGAPPDFQPMTTLAVALALGYREDFIMRVERDGLEELKVHYRTASAMDAVGKFDHDRSIQEVVKQELLNPQIRGRQKGV